MTSHKHPNTPPLSRSGKLLYYWVVTSTAVILCPSTPGISVAGKISSRQLSDHWDTITILNAGVGCWFG